MIDYDEKTFTYKKLMIKLAFEELVKHVQLNYNFEFIYEFVKLFKDDLTCIKLQLLDTTHLKSNNYYLMAIIPKLTKLKILKLYKDPDSLAFGKNGINFLQKAFNFFTKNGGELSKYEFGHGINSLTQDFMYAQLKQMANLQVLKITNYQIKRDESKAIGKYLSDHLSMKELDLTDTQLSTDCAKDIADGLMRAKNLEILKLANNPNLECSQILYNMAFSPKIKHLDFTSSCTTITNLNPIVESLFKLLKISGSVETVLFGQTKIFAHLSEDLCKAIGDSVSIKHINFDAPVGTTGIQCKMNILFKAIAMNAYKKGQLTSVSLKRCVFKSINYAVERFWISEQDHEYWYGDRNEAAKMEKEQLVKKMYFGLKHLDIGFGKLTNTGFKLKTYEV